MITLKDVEIGYEGRAIMIPVDLHVPKGEFIGVIGTNGGGKSTLIKTILGLLPVVSGQISRGSDCVFGYVPQTDGFDDIYPVSVKDLVLTGRYGRVGVGRRLNDSDREIVLQSMERVGIEHLRDRTYRSLSGGEKQRALIARAAAAEPAVLVLDEPTASVDVKGEREIMGLIEQLRVELGISVIMVSHYLSTVSEYADRLILIDKDSGVFSAGGVSEILSSECIEKIFGMKIDAAGMGTGI